MIQTTFSFDSEEILKEIYALTALRAHMLRQRGELSIFTSDQHRGLKRAMESAFYNVLARLVDKVTAYSVPQTKASSDTPTGIYSITLSLSDDFPPSLNNLLCKALNSAIVFETLHLTAIDGQDDLSREYKSRADNSVKNARLIMRSFDSPELHIVAHW